MTVHLVYRPAFRSVAFRSRNDDRMVAREHRRLRRFLIGLVRSLIWTAGISVAMAVWAIAAEMGFVLQFGIRTGVLSHWQVWFASGAFMLGSASMLARLVRPGLIPKKASEEAFRAA
jgi:hypothetical protein